MAKKSTSTRDLIITAGSLIFVIAVVLLFIPIAMTPTTTPTMGVPAEFGDTSVEEMIVQPQPQPITTFCKIYPDASTCR